MELFLEFLPLLLFQLHRSQKRGEKLERCILFGNEGKFNLFFWQKKKCINALFGKLLKCNGKLNVLVKISLTRLHGVVVITSSWRGEGSRINTGWSQSFSLCFLFMKDLLVDLIDWGFHHTVFLPRCESSAGRSPPSPHRARFALPNNPHWSWTLCSHFWCRQS